jgi:hypothetical protein
MDYSREHIAAIKTKWRPSVTVQPGPPDVLGSWNAAGKPPPQQQAPDADVDVLGQWTPQTPKAAPAEQQAPPLAQGTVPVQQSSVMDLLREHWPEAAGAAAATLPGVGPAAGAVAKLAGRAALPVVKFAGKKLVNMGVEAAGLEAFDQIFLGGHGTRTLHDLIDRLGSDRQR